MNQARILRAIESPTEDAISALLDDPSTVFWVDWREEDEAIVESCESILQTGSLSGEIVAIGQSGLELRLNYKDKRLNAPLALGVEDRHITLVSLNKVLSPDYEIRLCIDSNGSDTLAFLPLPCDVWRELEAQYGDAVARRFYQLKMKPNVFTDRLPF